MGIDRKDIAMATVRVNGVRITFEVDPLPMDGTGRALDGVDEELLKRCAGQFVRGLANARSARTNAVRHDLLRALADAIGHHNDKTGVPEFILHESDAASV